MECVIKRWLSLSHSRVVSGIHYIFYTPIKRQNILCDHQWGASIEVSTQKLMRPTFTKLHGNIAHDQCKVGIVNGVIGVKIKVTVSVHSITGWQQTNVMGLFCSIRKCSCSPCVSENHSMHSYYWYITVYFLLGITYCSVIYLSFKNLLKHPSLTLSVCVFYLCLDLRCPLSKRAKATQLQCISFHLFSYYAQLFP